MFNSLFNWCFGYTPLDKYENNLVIYADCDYIVVIKSNTSTLKFRKYTNLFKFVKKDTNSLELVYNSKRDIIYTDRFCVFDKLKLTEFIHLVLPNAQLEINYIPVEDYYSNFYIPDMTDYFEEEDNYICKCKSNSEKCIYHKFLIENLYNKYKK